MRQAQRQREGALLLRLFSQETGNGEKLPKRFLELNKNPGKLRSLVSDSERGLVQGLATPESFP